MASPKQLEANRLNAQKSTGPRTEEGKNTSRFNALKHGLTGHLSRMTAEEQQARDTFIADIVESLKPADALERQLANSVAEGYWRINRVAAIENNLFADPGAAAESDHAAAESDHETAEPPLLDSAIAFVDHPERFQLLTIYEMRLHRKIKSDLGQLRDLQTARRTAEENKAAAQKAANSKAFAESCDLLELELRTKDSVDLDGRLTHPNGFVFSVPKLLHAMAVNRRVDRARRISVNNPFTSDELESFLPAPLTWVTSAVSGK